MEKNSERRKRAFSDCKLEESRKKARENVKHNCSKPKEIERKNTCFASKPPGKVQFLGPHLLKHGLCPKPKVTTTIVTTKKPLTNVRSNDRKITSNSNDKLMDSRHLERKKPTSFKPQESSYGQKSNGESNLRKMTPNVENEKLKRFGHKDLGKSRSYLDSRQTRKPKYWDPICSKEANAQKLTETITVDVSPKEKIMREKIKEAMIEFEQAYEKLYKDNASKENRTNIASWRIPYEAAKIVKRNLKWKDPEKTLGRICVVQVGDTFKFRSQLQMVGLHSQPVLGIDYTKINGKNLALSIVDSHRYLNESVSCDTLSYSGFGGCYLGRKLPLRDQKLEQGNLALKNSKDEKNLVRVIRKVVGIGKKKVFAYDGLYIVKSYKQVRSLEGKIVFKFELDRVSGQPQLHKMLKRRRFT